MRATATIIAAALTILLWAPSATAETRARLLVKGNASPGSEITIQVELSWDGRPEQILPRVPQVEIPDGAALRLGSTGSRYDGERSVWWTNGTVTLPDRGGPYVIGPASIPTATMTGDGPLIVADPRTMGRGRRRSLLGQGLASGLLLALALGLVTRWWRRLLRAEEMADPIGETARRLHATLDAGQTQAAVDDGLALYDLLAAHPVARDYLGTRQGLEIQRDEIAFGGQVVEVGTVRERVGPLLAIARSLE